MLYDGNDDLLTYWQISGLEAGQESEVLIVGIDCPQDSDFTVTDDPNVNVLARRHGTADAYQDISVAPISLRALSGRIQFDVKLLAAADITGFLRVALSPGVMSDRPADWQG